MAGMSNIFVNGQEIALIGSPVSCGGAVAQGSSDTVGS
jgi:uncharacterized Zn-binding protein involved in type VI secretion